MEAAIALAALLAFAPKRKAAAVAPPPQKESSVSAKVNEVVDTATKVGGAAVGVVGVVKAGVAAIKSGATTVGNTIGATVGATVAGVSTGFVVVGGLWAVALIVGIVVGKVLAPEIDRRRTLPAWLTSEPWGIAWRMSREFWLAAIESKTTGFVRRSCRWVPGDGRYGDLNVQGELTFLVGGEQEPPSDRFDFYGWLGWARARYGYKRVAELVTAENDAHYLARVFGRAFLIASRTVSIVSGQSQADSSQMADLSAEGFTPLAAGSIAVPSSATSANVEDLVQAISAGVAAGIGVSRSSYGPGGDWLLSKVSRSEVALAVSAQLRAAGWVWISVDGPAVVFGRFGRVEMPGGLP